MQRVFLSIIFLFICGEVLSQATANFNPNLSNYTLNPGTFSFRDDVNGSATAGYYPLVSWNSSAYTEGHLKRYNVIFAMNYRLLKPVGYDPGYEDGYPMIVMMHGAGERGNCWGGNCYWSNGSWTPFLSPSDPLYNDPEAGPSTNPVLLNNDHNMVHGGKPHLDAVNLAGSKLPEDPTLNPRAFPGYVLFPQNLNGWTGGQSEDLLRIIYKLVESENINPNRIYVHGLSNGAQWLSITLTKDPGVFASAGLMSPVGAQYTFQNSSLAHIPIWAFQGGNDNNPSPDQTENLVRFHTELGGSSRYTLYPTLGHGTWNAAYAEPDFFSWMLDKSKSRAHVYYLDSTLCPTNSSGIELGFTAGWPAYQWEKDGQLMGFTTEKITALEPGVYRGRFSRTSAVPTENEWNTWSDPVLITESEALNAEITKHTSMHIPDINGSTNAIITGVQQENVNYKWFIDDIEQTGLNDTIRYISTSVSGKYNLITETYGGCESLASSPVHITFNSPNTLIVPENLVGIPVGSGSIQLFWDDLSSDETGYELVRSASPTGPYDFVALLEEDAIGFVDTNLPSGSLFYYRLRGVSNSAVSDYTSNSPASTNGDLTPPSPPSNLISTNVGLTNVSLSWSPSTDDTGIQQYYIYYGSDSIATGSSSTTFVVTGLLPEFTFAFTVKAVDFDGNFSQPSNQINVSTVFSGLDYTHSTGAWSNLGQIDWNFVEFTGHVDNFTLDPRTQEDFINFRFTGYLFIENAGDYDFRIYSDDGSNLSIGGIEIVNNDGLHGCNQKTTNNYALTAGTHSIEVKFFERTGGQCLNVQYRGPDSGDIWVDIPDSALRSGNVTTSNGPIAPPVNLIASSPTMSSIDLDWDYLGENPENLKIVVLGSSTAAGTGATPISNSWVNQLDTWLSSNTTGHTLTNLAVGGFTTEHIRENGTVVGAGSEDNKYFAVDPTKNIDAALALKPNIIIINLPSNNVATGISPATTLSHYSEIKAKADAAGVIVFITTTQPRNFTQQSDRDLLTDEADLVIANFGNYALKIYNELTDFTNNKAIKATYDFGDNIHINNAGHSYIFGVVQAKLNQFMTNFEVYRSLDNMAFENIATVSASNYTSDNLLPSTLYYYKVRSKNINGYSVFTSVVSSTTLEDSEAPTVPTNVNLISNTYTNAGFSWMASSDNIGVAKYYVYANAVLIDSTNYTTFSTSSLLPDTQYSITVSALDASGNQSAQSTPVVFTTDAPQMFYSKNTGDLTDVNSWGNIPDGSGATPPNFSYNGQYFKVTNRSSATVSNIWNINGNISRIIIDDNTDLVIDNSILGKIDVGENSTVTVNYDFSPEFMSIPASSTIIYNTYSSIPLNSYGSLVLNGTGLKTIGPGVLSVAADLTINDGVGLKGSSGNSTTLQLYGNLDQLGTSPTPSSDNVIGLTLMGSNHDLSFASDQSFYEIASVDGSTINIITASPLQIQLGSLNGGGLNLSPVSLIGIGNNTLQVRNAGTINSSNNTSQISSNLGSIELISSASTASHLRMDPTNNDIQDLILNITGSGQLLVENSAEIYNSLSVLNGTVDSQGNLQIKSDVGYNASISEIKGSGQILGDVTVERYLSNFPGKVYRYLASPVDGLTVAGWQASIPITGNFDDSDNQSPNSSMFYYEEGNGGWKPFPPSGGSNTMALTKGMGYSVFMWNGDQNQKLLSTGNPFQGDVDFTNLAQGTGGNDGWTLIANPYASDIYWDNANWTSTDVGNFAYIRSKVESPPSETYVTIDRTTPAKIAAGQSFWVQTTSASPSLTVHESAKSSDLATSSSPHYRVDNSDPTNKDHFIVQLEKQGLEFIDKTTIKFSKDGSDLFEKGKDGMKLLNSNINISSFSSDNANLAVNQLEDVFCTKNISLSIKVEEVGSYTIRLPDALTFSLGNLYFIDSFEDVIETIDDNFSYNFIIDDLTNSLDDRFKILVERPDIISSSASLEEEEICELDKSFRLTLSESQFGVNYRIKNVSTGEEIFEVTGSGLAILAQIGTDALIMGKNELEISALFSGCEEIKIGENLIVEMFEESITTVENDYFTTCESSVKLSAMGGSSYNWYSADTGDFLENNTGEFIADNLNGLTVYEVKAVNELGCESSKGKIIQINSAQIAKPVLAMDNGILMVDSTSYNIQWYFNNEPVENAMNLQYTPNRSGTYKVRFTNNVCSTYSDSFDYSITGFDTSISNESLSLSVYPNPVTSNVITIRGDTQSKSAMNLMIVDLFGRIIYRQTFEASAYISGITIQNNFSPGLYLIKLSQDGNSLDKKFLVK